MAAAQPAPVAAAEPSAVDGAPDHPNGGAAGTRADGLIAFEGILRAVPVIFRFPERERPISDEEAGWLLGQLRAARELTAAAASVAAKLEQSLEAGASLQATLEEQRELLAALERGAARPRSGPLRSLEVELHAAVFSARYRSAG